MNPVASSETSGTRVFSPTTIVTLTIIVLAFGAYAVFLGESNCWDLRNYHLYDGWAFWTGRESMDFAAAQLQTYFNPLLATVTYLIFVHTSPWVSAFILGVIQGANIFPLYAISRRLLPASVHHKHTASRIALAVAFAGVTGATALGELGSSMGDNLISLPVLCAFSLILRDANLNWCRAICAGMLVGAATGIKLTAAPFALGIVMIVPLLDDKGSAWRVALATLAASALGFAATDGFWMIRLWQEYGNPLHPMFGSVFHSAYAPPLSLRDTRYLPHDLLEWMFYPLVWSVSPHKVSEMWFRDLRIPLAFLALSVLLWPGSRQKLARPIRVAAIALLIAYLAWLPVFGTYRYLAPLEMLAPLMALLAITRLFGHVQRAFAFAFLAFLVITTRPPHWGRLRHFAPEFLTISVPDIPDIDGATVIFAEDEPLAYLALGFPPTVTFVRIAGNLMGPPYPPSGLDAAAERRIAEAKGSLYALVAKPVTARTLAAFARQRLVLGDVCYRVSSNLMPKGNKALLCNVQRAPAKS
ncbi:MAG: DUF2029 domain-containing protein [Xanthomonadaceae bacterium]|nr:DUF2029 domain-containing protein [Xanthomonadaceae bacterium]